MKTEGCESRMCSAVSFLLGGLVGAAVGMLVAPKPGKETRQQIRGLAGDVKGKAEDYYDDVKHSVSAALKDGKGFIEEKKERIENAVRAGIEAYEKKGE